MQDVIAKDTDAELYVGVGAKYRVDNGWGLRADARMLFPPSSRGNGPTVDFEALLSIYKEFGRKVVEKVVEAPEAVRRTSTATASRTTADKCPNEPEDKDGFQDDDGCPDPRQRRRRHPGRAATSARCEPEDKDGFQDDDGCPESGQRQRRHPGRRRQVPERGRGQGRLPGRRRLPGSRQRRRRRARRAATSARISRRPRTATRTTTAAPTRFRRR